LEGGILLEISTACAGDLGEGPRFQSPYRAERRAIGDWKQGLPARRRL
jgi:hypothetical protein